MQANIRPFSRQDVYSFSLDLARLVSAVVALLAADVILFQRDTPILTVEKPWQTLWLAVLTLVVVKMMQRQR